MKSAPLVYQQDNHLWGLMNLTEDDLRALFRVALHIGGDNDGPRGTTERIGKAIENKMCWNDFWGEDMLSQITGWHIERLSALMWERGDAEPQDSTCGFFQEKGAFNGSS